VPGLVRNVGQAARLIAALVVLTAAAPAAAADFTLTLPHGGLTRSALVHAPAGVRAAFPVVVTTLLGPRTNVIDANEEISRR
jgi:poly(3-hydroxybutyrate) depolymerase